MGNGRAEDHTPPGLSSGDPLVTRRTRHVSAVETPPPEQQPTGRQLPALRRAA